MLGRVVAIEGIAHDITERLQDQDALRVSEKRYRSLADNSEVGILQVTPEGSPIVIPIVMVLVIVRWPYLKLKTPNLRKSWKFVPVDSAQDQCVWSPVLPSSARIPL